MNDFATPTNLALAISIAFFLLALVRISKLNEDIKELKDASRSVGE